MGTKLTTPGRIAAMLGVPLHRVQHVLRTRQNIQPAARAGCLRLYDRSAVERVRVEIKAIDDRHAIRQEGSR